MSRILSVFDICMLLFCMLQHILLILVGCQFISKMSETPTVYSIKLQVHKARQISNALALKSHRQKLSSCIKSKQRAKVKKLAAHKQQQNPLQKNICLTPTQMQFLFHQHQFIQQKQFQQQLIRNQNQPTQTLPTQAQKIQYYFPMQTQTQTHIQTQTQIYTQPKPQC